MFQPSQLPIPNDAEGSDCAGPFEDDFSLLHNTLPGLHRNQGFTIIPISLKGLWQS